MIDPNQITKFDRTTNELQEFLLFSVVVAGKNSKIQSEKLAEFIALVITRYHNGCVQSIKDKTIFDLLQAFTTLEIELMLRWVKMGQYVRLSNLIYELANSDLDLKTVTVPQLEQIYGIGPKTARFFVLHTQKDACCAVLDTHILKHLNAHGIKAPKNTPSNKKTYKRLEDAFITLHKIARLSCKEMTLADYDLVVWQYYSAGNHKTTK